MPFDSLSAFIAMGGHGPYVWTSYGVSALVIALCILAPRWRLRRIIARERRLMRRREAA
ncbi:MAG: heme exporter protein CcmD [Oleiphilaceae bacterium]|nr:heme exporter protein CcmD [Oleiphilaceae bacterium]